MEYRLQNYCDRCKKKFDKGEAIIIKVPERIYFCIDCAEEKPDTKNFWWMCTTYDDGVILEHII